MDGKEIWDKITEFSNQKSGQLLGRELRDQTLALEPVKTALQQEADFAIELIDKAIRSAKWETANRGLIYADNHGQEIMEGSVRSLFNAMMEGLSLEDCLSRAEMEERYIELAANKQKELSKQLHNMELGDMLITALHDITRVPGGWIYFCGGESTFVPFNSEFQGTDGKKRRCKDRFVKIDFRGVQYLPRLSPAGLLLH